MDETAGDPRDPEALVKAFLQYKIMEQMQDYLMESGEREPIGARILEVPDDLLRFESRDPRSTFTAYVPIGSIAKGEALVTKGGSGKTIQCALCHGAYLTGLGPLPSIAGRSPSYMFRQLYDFQHGARAGEWGAR